MKNKQIKILAIASLVLACIVISLANITRITQLPLSNLIAADEPENGYLPIVLSHTAPTETAVPTITITPTHIASPTISPTGEPTVTSQATTTPPSTPTPSHTPTSTSSPTATPSPTATSAATATTQPPGDAIIIDHHAVALFDHIPEEYLSAAANLNMLFIDRSVGANIDDGLACLNFPSDEDAPNHCSRHEHLVSEFSVDPEVVSWYRPGGYDRSNWGFLFWDETLDCNYWHDKVRCFIEMVMPVMSQYDVVSFQFSYLEVADDSTIASESEGYFWNSPDNYDVFDQEAFEAQYPDKVFIYWTTSLARGIGSEVSVTFNDQMRQYAIANGKPLFDVAAILSHDPDGNPCYDNRDGIPYDNGNNSENYPDDGWDRLAVCQHYTTETDGGHLGSVSAGKIRVAKAFWVLMARLAGWDGVPVP